MGKVYPRAYNQLDQLDQIISSSTLNAWYKELIKIRASQINGCAYCVHYHVAEAIKLNIPCSKIHLIAVWKESPNVFSEQERLLLSMTEEITLIHLSGLSKKNYDRSIDLFGIEYTAHIIMMIILINAWNRIGVALKLEPEMI